MSDTPTTFTPDPDLTPAAEKRKPGRPRKPRPDPDKAPPVEKLFQVLLPDGTFEIHVGTSYLMAFNTLSVRHCGRLVQAFAAGEWRRVAELAR